jgi:hypothetical protein
MPIYIQHISIKHKYNKPFMIGKMGLYNFLILANKHFNATYSSIMAHSCCLQYAISSKFGQKKPEKSSISSFIFWLLSLIFRLAAPCVYVYSARERERENKSQHKMKICVFINARPRAFYSPTYTLTIENKIMPRQWECLMEVFVVIASGANYDYFLQLSSLSSI